MSLRPDIVTNDSGELVRREHARELGAGVVIAIYRLAKLAQMHDLGNAALARQLDQTEQSIKEYGLRAGTNVNVLFADKAVFVAGQLLKGSRGTYESASELGAILERLGGSELFIHRETSREELFAFVEQIAAGHRSAPGSFRELTPNIRLRPVNDAARMRGLQLEALTAEERIVRTYASAVVIMRRFYEDLDAGRHVLPRRLKRIAQSLVDLSEGATLSFLGVTEVRNANHDAAGRAVNTAILAVSMMRELSRDRSALAHLAMAAMMHDVGRPRALALAGGGEPDLPGMAGPSVLSDDQEDHLPAGTAAVLTALGRVNEPSMRRTVLTFEALWLRRETWLGPVYEGKRASSLQARLIAVARRYNDLLTPEPGTLPRTPDAAVSHLAEELKDAEGRSVLRLLLAALDLLPKGTELVLASGEIAEVVRGPRRIGDSARVRIVGDAAGNLADGEELELGSDPRRAVTRIKSVEGWKRALEDEASSRPPRPFDDEDDVAASADVAPASVEAPAEELVDAEPAPLPALAADDVAPAYDGDSDLPPALESNSVVATEEDAPSSPELADVVRPTEPTATGDLGATPLPHVLVYMLDHALSGSVVFEGDGGEDIVHFEAGVPTKIRLRAPVARLGSVLRDSGAIDEEALEEAARGAASVGVLLGEFLIGDDLVTDEQVSRALEVQLLRSVAHLANLPPSFTYAFYEDVDLLAALSRARSAHTTPLSPILAAVRAWSERDRIRATLDRIGNHPLVIHPEAAVSDLVMLPEESEVLALLRRDAISLTSLRARADASEDTISSLVYALAVTRQFAFKGQRKGPMAARALYVTAPVPVPVVPARSERGESPRPPVVAEPAQGVAEPVAGASDTAEAAAPNPVAATSVEETSAAASSEQTSEVSAEPPPRPRAVAPSSTAHQARPRPQIRPISPAARPPGAARASVPQIRPIRSTPPRSTPHGAPPAGRIAARSMLFGGDTDDDASAATRAAASFSSAEQALARNDLAAAQKYARQAVEDDPLRTDYYALLAWVQSLRMPDDALDASIATMTDLLGDDPRNTRVLYYRARLALRVGDVATARADFTALLSIDPTHPTVKRELAALP